ncbi:MAG: energy-coupling factor ABC transporter ATP-binding protein [Bacillaceae bacterium]|nr:energy-coupling factor ABC transporter ATP-binding protein [Bacillaceae bacterium]
MQEPAVRFDHVSFRYEKNGPNALEDVSFAVRPGEWLAIVGHNGSGKSTIAKLMIGLLFPESGEITVGNIRLSEETIWDVRSKVGMVFQNPDNQFVGSTVQDDVAFGLENRGIPREVMADRVFEALKRVKMEEFLDQEPHHLSGGQKQRVAIAGVIALAPEIMILDEATSMLDPRGRKEVIETIRDIKSSADLTIISITHDLEETLQADRILIMNQGKVFHIGNPEELVSFGDRLYELGLDAPFVHKLIKGLKNRGIDIPDRDFTEETLVDYLWKLLQRN